MRMRMRINKYTIKKLKDDEGSEDLLASDHNDDDDDVDDDSFSIEIED